MDDRQVGQVKQYAAYATITVVAVVSVFAGLGIVIKILSYISIGG